MTFVTDRYKDTSSLRAGIDDISRERVSICMPVSRNTSWLCDAIASVLAQTITNFEVIITDDSGTLGEIVQSFNDSRLRYIANSSPLGFAANHCQAIAAARAPYIAFLHDDDRWEPTYLERAIAVLDEHPHVGLVLSGATEIDADNKPLGRRPTTMKNGEQVDPLSAFLSPDCMMLLPSLTLVRATAMAANTRPWPDLIAADLTLYVDVATAGWAIYYLDTPLVWYRTHQQQIGNNSLAHRHALVTVWSSYRFEHTHLETLRKARLGALFTSRAGAHIRLGHPGAARADLSAARMTHRDSVGYRWYLLQALTFFPGAIPFAKHVRAYFHDAVKSRHRGA